MLWRNWYHLTLLVFLLSSSIYFLSYVFYLSLHFLNLVQLFNLLFSSLCLVLHSTVYLHLVIFPFLFQMFSSSFYFILQYLHLTCVLFIFIQTCLSSLSFSFFLVLFLGILFSLSLCFFLLYFLDYILHFIIDFLLVLNLGLIKFIHDSLQNGTITLLLFPLFLFNVHNENNTQILT